MKFDAVLIAGPTASGKSAAALVLAQNLDGIIVNADSMQVYREAPILTTQPSVADKKRAAHLLYGHVSVREPYSVGRYITDAAAVLAEARAQEQIPIFVGGTGLYFAALTEGIADIPATPPRVRAEARALREKIGAAAFHALIASKNSQSAAVLRVGDTQRTLRAYEVFVATGRPLSEWRRTNTKPLLADYGLAKFVLNPPRAELHARIAARLGRMFAGGAKEEAAALVDLAADLPAAKILGLRPLQEVNAGRGDEATALAAAIVATRQYAKRQMTWFRQRMIDYIWFNPYVSNVIAEFERLTA